MVSFSEDSSRAMRGPGGVNLKALKKAVAVSDASIFLRTLSLAWKSAGQPYISTPP